MDSRLPVVHQRRELFTCQNGDLSFGWQDFGTSRGRLLEVETWFHWFLEKKLENLHFEAKDNEVGWKIMILWTLFN